LWIESGRWKGPEIRDRLLDINKRYMPVEIAVEANAQQKYIRQFVGESNIVTPIQDHFTGGGKNAMRWGVKSLAAEFEDRRWIVPRWKVEPNAHEDDIAREYDPDVHALFYGATNYSPERHPSDHLVALWITWCRIMKYQGE